MNPQRIKLLNEATAKTGPVVYWMGRDQRVQHNHALLFAAGLAKKKGLPFYVLFCLLPEFSGASRAHYSFMLKGLQETSQSLEQHGIPMIVVHGDPVEKVPAVIREHKASALIMDFDPLRHRREWKTALLKKIEIAMYEVDAHNIVPCWVASPKAEFGAYTLRPKILRLLPEFLEPFPEVPVFTGQAGIGTDWKMLERTIKAPKLEFTSTTINAGETAAHMALRDFLEYGLPEYHLQRNDPNLDGQSGLSPWIHFGQLSAQYVALCVKSSQADEQAKKAFLEELIVRRELSDNFCYYNTAYDTIDGIHSWARISLEAHRKDERAFVYTQDEWELAKTHDELWNAAQQQMMQTGKMHGYMRMYWAKKILEWSESPEAAIKTAIYLNDRYSLDGRDPNGYAGILWSIGGLHDRAWGERPVYGKIRYMNAEGCKRKFDVKAYIARWTDTC